MQFSLTPDILFNTRQSRQNATLRARLETVGQEAITGRRTDVLQATNGQIGDAFLLEKASQDISRQVGMANLATARLDGATNSISTIRETLIDFSSDARVSFETGSSNEFALMASGAEDALSHVMSSLSLRHGTRHLFSGTQSAGGPLASQEELQTAINAAISGAASGTDAVTAINDYFGAGGGFETDIYQGSVEDGPRLHITDTDSFDPLPKADDQLFRDMMQGFAMIAGASQAATEADRDQLIEAGINLLNGAVDGALVTESRLGAAQQSIERIEAGLQTEASLVSTTLSKLLGRDVFDAAAELQALEGQLEASYTVTGRLGSLSLANFLR
ncbi:flagellin [Algimonas arctica]|uniref:Flagellin n=1 Tax=Algimonas arctica TaxID=1479486 RepID=A0A8J3CR90_9PROT|nr:flagellin [Algimonas arctica]GHA89460.1 flagellin [Algimonas arctica]